MFVEKAEKKPRVAKAERKPRIAKPKVAEIKPKVSNREIAMEINSQFKKC
jgi:coenzyme PQQ precursor peptide PqqA